MKNRIMMLIVGFVFVGCNPKFYVPNTQNVPLLSEKGETNVSAIGNGNQFEVQGAYAISDQIGIQLNTGIFIPSDLDNGNGGSGNFMEIGGGYFHPFANDFVFETNALFGIGQFENHLPSTVNNYPETTGNISSNIFRYGLQPSFGYKKNNFAIIASTRILGLNYNSIKGNLMFEENDQVQYLNDNRSNFLIEPALTLRGGFEKIKFQVQYGLSVNLSNSEFRQDNNYLTLGVNLNFR